MRRRLGRRSGDRGLTLIELVVAILVLSLGTLATIRAGDQAQQGLAGAVPRLLAQVVAENRAAELRALGTAVPLPGQVQMGGQTFTISTEQQATAGGLVRAAITVRSQAGPGAHLVAFVPPLGPGS